MPVQAVLADQTHTGNVIQQIHPQRIAEFRIDQRSYKSVAPVSVSASSNHNHSTLSSTLSHYRVFDAAQAHHGKVSPSLQQDPFELMVAAIRLRA